MVHGISRPFIPLKEVGTTFIDMTADQILPFFQVRFEDVNLICQVMPCELINLRGIMFPFQLDITVKA